MKAPRLSSYPRRTLALVGLLVFTFTFVGLPSFTKYYVKTNVLDSIDVLGWMTQITDSNFELSSLEEEEPLMLRRGVKVMTTSTRSSVIDSSMGVIDSSMGVVDSSMGVIDSSMGVK